MQTDAQKAQTVLVTGGAGFIGSHTAEALMRRGVPVVVVDELNDAYDIRQKLHNIDVLTKTAEETGTYLRFYRGSCDDAAFMKSIFTAESIGRVCHLAARAGVRPSIKNPHLYIQANVTATIVLLDLCRDHGVRHMVYASSSSVYGRNVKVPFSESDRTDHPVSPYAASKKACELLAATYSHLYGIMTVGLRFFTVYGPRGRPDMAPFIFVDSIARGIPINQFGDGSSSRDYTYIDDIVSGILSALNLSVPPQHASQESLARVYNLGNSTSVTLHDFIRTIEDLVGRKADVRVLPDQPGDVPHTFADLTLSSHELGYKPTTSIRDGMRRFVDWYFEYKSQRDDHETADGSDAIRSYALPHDILVKPAPSCSGDSTHGSDVGSKSTLDDGDTDVDTDSSSSKEYLHKHHRVDSCEMDVASIDRYAFESS